MDGTRHEFEENKASHRWKHLVLAFSSGHTLAGKEIYEEAGDDVEPQIELIPAISSYTSIHNAVNTVHYAAWKVCRTDIRPTKRGKVEHKKKKSKGAALLAGLMSKSSFSVGVECIVDDDAVDSSIVSYPNLKNCLFQFCRVLARCSTSFRRLQAVRYSEYYSDAGKFLMLDEAYWAAQQALTEKRALFQGVHASLGTDAIMNDETAHKKRLAGAGTDRKPRKSHT